MIYLSAFLGCEVVDAPGRSVGRVSDLILPGGSPIVQALVIKTPTRGTITLPWSAVARQQGKTLLLAVAAGHWPLYAPQESDLWLARDVLDRQVVDTTRAKVVRVNAILLADTPAGWRAQGVEIGGRGLLHRLGLEWLADRLGLRQQIVPWEELSFASGRGDRQGLEQLHPAEIADIVHELSPAEGSDLVEALAAEVAADTLEEVHPDRQANLLGDMAPERAADILEEMAPDEAADVLQDLPQQKAQELLQLMEQAEAAEVAELLAHPEDSVGGIMTTEYATLRPALTAAEAMAELRQRFAGELDDAHYVYVTDEAEHLLGVFSIWELVVADPQACLADFMQSKVVSLRADQKAEEAGRLMARYNLLAIPVVDDGDRLLGMVTIDDAMDLILPKQWRQQLPRMY
jgi:CBS domain-containing protein